MPTGEIFRVALEAVSTNKIRSALTMLGIIIGVGAVITMVALGSGARKSVQERMQALGPTLLTVFPGQSFRGGIASSQRAGLTMDDADALADADPRYIEAVVPELSGNLQVQYIAQNINTSVIGTTANYVQVHNGETVAGRMFTPGDDAARRRYAVLGGDVPGMLGSSAAAIVNQDILIRGIPFHVLGVLARKGSQGPFFNPDEQILVPLQTARFRIFGTDRLRSITVEARTTAQMPLAMIEIESALRRQHKIGPGGANDFQIRSQMDILSTFEETTRTFGSLLAGIAAVSLLVGGIGIMNIMLVSVIERTREIGVRKALGATRSNILFQFLVEALVLCLAGGVAGVIVGAGGAVILSRLAHWNTSISLYAVLLAFFFSALVGLVFGVWPARRASRLDPIDALRYE